MTNKINCFRECKFFTDQNHSIEPNLLKFCKKVSDQYNISFTGKSIAVIDINKVDDLLKQWNTEMHGIIPYYAIKALPDNKIIDKLSHFDCAINCLNIALNLS